MPAKKPTRPKKVAPGPAETHEPPPPVQPLEHAEPAIARNYDPGFEEPPEKDPWIDEGRPEASG